MRAIYPFTAIVGQQRMIRALVLNAIDPRIGGVLIRGERGTAKSTAARAMAALLPEIEVYGTRWCPDCHRTTAFLQTHGVPFRYLDVEAEGLEQRVIEMNIEAGHGPRRRVPTLTIDGRILSVPSNAQLSELLEV